MAHLALMLAGGFLMRDSHGPHGPYAAMWRRLEDAVLRHPGTLDTTTRVSLADLRDIPEPLAVYTEKVARYAYKITDDDVRALLAAGYSQDQIFEATLAVALGAAQTRLRAGLAALREAAGASDRQPAGDTGEEE
jgi:hypothetical protein